MVDVKKASRMTRLFFYSIYGSSLEFTPDLIRGEDDEGKREDDPGSSPGQVQGKGADDEGPVIYGAQE